MAVAKKVTSVRLSLDVVEKLEKMLKVYQEFADVQAQKFSMIAPEVKNAQVIESCIVKEYERLKKEGYVS